MKERECWKLWRKIKEVLVELLGATVLEWCEIWITKGK